MLTGSDPNNSTPLTYTVTQQPRCGKLTGTAPNLTYAPDDSFQGLDSFLFIVTSKDGTESSPATVSIAVGKARAPTANDQSVVTRTDRPVKITLTATDPNTVPLTPLTYSITQQPARGTAYTVTNEASDSFNHTVASGGVRPDRCAFPPDRDRNAPRPEPHHQRPPHRTCRDSGGRGEGANADTLAWLDRVTQAGVETWKEVP